jgi:hypothetical protein
MMYDDSSRAYTRADPASLPGVLSRPPECLSHAIDRRTIRIPLPTAVVLCSKHPATYRGR